MSAQKNNLFFKRIILLAITTIFLLFLFEITLRATYPLYDNYNTEMWRYASESKQLSTFVGHEHVPNQVNLLYGVEIRTNSLGLRADQEYVVPKPDKVTRILVLGDSITMGWGVEYENTYPRILEKLLNKDTTTKIEVINTGVGNYNSVAELATLKKFFYLNPDLIILGFYINDIEQISYPSQISYWIKRNSYVYAFFKDRLINVEFRGRKDARNYYDSLYQDAQLREKLKATLNEIMQFSDDRSIPFVFVNIPEFHQFAEYPFPEVNAFLEEEVLMDKNIKYINLLPVFQQEGIPPEELWVSLEDPHPNAQGQEIIAKTIFGEIKQKIHKG